MDHRTQTRLDASLVSSDESDRQLLSRIDAGDRDALSELYRRYYHSLLNFIRRVTGQLDLAQEGVNDVMLVVWRNSPSFAGRSKVSTWIMGIAYRKALKLLAASRRWSSRLAPVDFDDWLEHSEVPAATNDDSELRDLLERALARAPRGRRVDVLQRLLVPGHCGDRRLPGQHGQDAHVSRSRAPART